MPKRGKGSRTKKKASTTRPTQVRAKRTLTTSESPTATTPSPSHGMLVSRPESPLRPPKKRFTRSRAASSTQPRVPQTQQMSRSPPISHRRVGLPSGDANGIVEEADSDDVTMVQSPLKRLRRQPQRFTSRSVAEAPSKKSMFEGISRDSLQRYMAHYQIPKRQDLKKNLVKRVQKHFDEMDVSDIDLMDLHRGVVERLRSTAMDSPGKLGNAGR